MIGHIQEKGAYLVILCEPVHRRALASLFVANSVVLEAVFFQVSLIA